MLGGVRSNMLRFDGPPRSHDADAMLELVNAYRAMTSARDDGGGMSSDDALWALWRLAGERYAPELVETLILTVGQP
jgi:response regulator RpfG family c-di-GMP phosphodiesterase